MDEIIDQVIVLSDLSGHNKESKDQQKLITTKDQLKC